MARKAKTPPRRKAGGPVGEGSVHERIVQAFMTLLADKPFERISLPEIATAAGVSLAELRDGYASPLAILAAHMKAVDRAVLDGDDPEMAGEPARERLFDVMMRRLDALAPHKAAIGSLARSARLDPALAFALNRMAVRSMQWMLAAAQIDSSGPRGKLRAQGLAFVHTSVVRAWIDDDDPGLAPTMAALDRGLRRAGGWSSLLDELCRIPRAACGLRARLRGLRRRGADLEEGEAA